MLVASLRPHQTIYQLIRHSYLILCDCGCLIRATQGTAYIKDRHARGAISFRIPLLRNRECTFYVRRHDERFVHRPQRHEGCTVGIDAHRLLSESALQSLVDEQTNLREKKQQRQRVNASESETREERDGHEWRTFLTS